MINKLKCLSLAAMVIVTTVASNAQAEAWLCDLRNVDSTGWLSYRVEFRVSKNGNALVYDSAIHEQFGKPIAAKISENAGKRLKLKWITPNLRADRDIVARPQYSLFFNRSTQRITTSAIIPYGNMPMNGFGTCTAKSEKSGFSKTSAPRKRYIIIIPDW